MNLWTAPKFWKKSSPNWWVFKNSIPKLVPGDKNPARSSAVDGDVEQHDDVASNARRHRTVDGEVRKDHEKDDVTR